jgi:hypothetical protein
LIEKTVVGVASEVAGVAKRADKRHRPVDTRSHTQQVVVGKVADDDIALPGKGGNCLEIGSDMSRPSFFGEPGRGPPVPVETPFKVATADEEQPCVKPCAAQGSTVELGHGARAGPLVGKDNHAHSHRQSIADRGPVNSTTELGKAIHWE